jgi:hypothetical protein
MRSSTMVPWFALALLFPVFSIAACIPVSEAGKHIGETKCVTGKVLRVEQGTDGVHYLNFCDDSKGCPFTAVIFPEDLKHIGDVRQLQGKSVEVHGDLREYDGEAQIIVSEPQQLKGEVAHIPPLPKNYDVEQKGHYSAGIFRHPKTYSTTKKRQPATLPVEIPEDPEQ